MANMDTFLEFYFLDVWYLIVGPIVYYDIIIYYNIIIFTPLY